MGGLHSVQELARVSTYKIDVGIDAIESTRNSSGITLNLNNHEQSARDQGGRRAAESRSRFPMKPRSIAAAAQDHLFGAKLRLHERPYARFETAQDRTGGEQLT